MASVSLRGVEKRYGSTVVLRGIDVEIDDGEYLVLVGPSGCGKSTLLRSIAGLVDISGGELAIGDRVVNQVSPRDRDVAMVFQSYALYPHMTVRQNLAFPLKIRRESAAAIEAAAAEVAALLALDELLDRLPGQLSGGQRQRVAMGRAIVRRPSVFLFDEPLSNLDASLRHQMRVELKRLHRELQTTTVHVTHDQVEALTLADRIMVLHKGVVQQLGTPRELFDAPANAFVATFIGSPAMNLLDATISEAGAVALDAVPGPTGLSAEARGPLTLGVRPTDITVGDGPVRARVDVVESLGAEALLHVELGSARAVVQVAEPTAVRAGDEIGLRFDVVHLFDRTTGARL